MLAQLAATAPTPRVPLPPLVLRSILFPSDLTPVSDAAFDHARLLAERCGAQVTLFHVVEASAPKDRVELESLRRSVEVAERRLAQRGSAQGAEVLVRTAPATASALIDLVRSRAPDLVVMATHGRTGLAHFFLGSVAERTLEEGGCPLLFVREPAHGVALPYRRVLVPTDFSEASRRAFPWVALLARSFDAEVLAVHVAPVPEKASVSGVPYVVEATLPSQQELRDFLRPEVEGVRVHPYVQMGSPWPEIVEIARMERADVVVLSTHGPDSLSDRVFGSHAERVVRQAPCPVLVV
jgi:nucleotide-binding universal stress UspA family protein